MQTNTLTQSGEALASRYQVILQWGGGYAYCSQKAADEFFAMRPQNSHERRARQWVEFYAVGAGENVSGAPYYASGRTLMRWARARVNSHCIPTMVEFVAKHKDSCDRYRFDPLLKNLVFVD